MLVCVIAFQQPISKVISKAAGSWLASVLQAASFVATALVHRSRAFDATGLSRQAFAHPAGILRRRLLDREAAQCQALRVLLHRSLCKCRTLPPMGSLRYKRYSSF